MKPIQGTAIVVIHPGSAYLKVGRASDTVPVIMPNVVARRKKSLEQPHYEDPLLPGVSRIVSMILQFSRLNPPDTCNLVL